MSSGSPWNPENKRIIDVLEELGSRLDRQPTPEELDAALRENGINQEVGAQIAAQPTYQQQPLEEDRARIIQYIHSLEPIQEKDGKIKGEVPIEIIFNLFGYLAHNSSFSDLDEDEIKAAQIGLERSALYVRMSMPRKKYTPEFALWMRNAQHLAKLRLNQNKDGTGLMHSTAQLIGEIKAVDMGQQGSTSRFKNIMRKIKQRNEK